MKKLAAFAAAIAMFSGSAFAEVTATAVKGTVGAMVARKMQPVAAGMKLPDDATIVTGANSEVTLAINNGTLTLKSLTTAKLGGISMTATSSTAAVALKTGTVVSEVKQLQGLKTSFTVTTPVGTSSVRGTTHTVSYGPERGMSVSVASGVVAVSSARGGTRPVVAGSSYVQSAGAAPPQVSTQSSQAAQEAARPGAAQAFAPAEEAAQAAQSDGGASELGAEALAELLPSSGTTGTVNVSLAFP